MVLQESGEMYLETIYILAQKSSYVRSIDVAEYMGFSKPRVSRSLGLLALARAFLHDAPFLLPDEPTSNLDSLNEAVILRSLREEGHDKTVILVSHRVSTMRIANKVYSVDHGRMS